MDSAELLDLLGNANRRRILRLLAHKPCYVTEISEYIGVSPKAVIDHLERLDDAGLVESNVDEQRRKYFRIARNLRLEVTVSPYQFGTKSAYPGSSIDVASCRHVSIDAEVQEDANPEELAAELDRLHDLDRELSLAQRWVHGRLSEVMAEFTDQFEGEDARLLGDVVSALATRSGTVEAISRRIEAPPEVVDEALQRLADEDIAERTGAEWQLAG